MTVHECAKAVVCAGMILVALLRASAQQQTPIYLEGEFGVAAFTNASVRSVFPAGAVVRLGAALALADENRLRLRPQLGATFFGNKIDESITEQLLFVGGGIEVSYDAFYVKQITFFPYVSASYRGVSNFDMESYDDTDATYSESHLRGSGIAQEIGLRIQLRDWYVKGGYQLFSPRLQARKSIVEDDLSGGYVTPSTHRFHFDTVSLSVGFSIRP